MSWGYVAVGVGTAVAGYMGSKSSKDAAKEAANAQIMAAVMGAQTQESQDVSIQRLLKPYVDAGVASIDQQQALLGLKGEDARSKAIKAIEGGDIFKGIAAQGESAILQNAAATGGLRGGNVQGALAQFRPRLLSDLIQQQFSNLGSISGLGQASAAGVGAAGQQSASTMIGLLGNIGAAQAGSALASGQAQAQNWNTLGQTIGTIGGIYAGGGF